MKPLSIASPPSSSALAFSCYRTYTCSSKIVAKKKKTPQIPSPKGSEPPPPRITANVRQSLRCLRLWKESQNKNSKTPKPTTRYRRKRVEKDELPDDTELYRDPPDPTLTRYDDTNQGIETAMPVLLVDGYNVCGYWEKLKKHFMSGRLAIARQMLVDELITFSRRREVKVVVVFDAMMSGLRTRKEHFNGIDIVYSAKTSADTWIERKVVTLKEDGCPEVWVATSDRFQQNSAYIAGAFVWSSELLVSMVNAISRTMIAIKIKDSQEEAEEMLLEHRSTSMQDSPDSPLKHNFDPKVVDALRDLRDKLSENH